MIDLCSFIVMLCFKVFADSRITVFTSHESHESHWNEYTAHCVLTIGGLFSFTLKVCDNFLLVNTGFTLTLIIEPRELISLRTRSADR